MTSAARYVCIALALTACKPSGGPRAPTPTPDASTDAAATSDEPAPDGEEEPPRCATDGTPWDGTPGTCTYEHGGCCYPTPEAMCAAAGCEAENCVILESSPAQARCTQPGPTS